MSAADTMATDIATAVGSGWAVEFRATVGGGPKAAVTCLFRQYGTVDVHSISREAGTSVDAFNAAKTAWASFLKWQSAA